MLQNYELKWKTSRLFKNGTLKYSVTGINQYLSQNKSNWKKMEISRIVEVICSV
jgi:hypothetical protein